MRRACSSSNPGAPMIEAVARGARGEAPVAIFDHGWRARRRVASIPSGARTSGHFRDSPHVGEALDEAKAGEDRRWEPS